MFIYAFSTYDKQTLKRDLPTHPRNGAFSIIKLDLRKRPPDTPTQRHIFNYQIGPSKVTHWHIQKRPPDTPKIDLLTHPKATPWHTQNRPTDTPKRDPLTHPKKTPWHTQKRPPDTPTQRRQYATRPWTETYWHTLHKNLLGIQRVSNPSTENQRISTRLTQIGEIRK